MSLISVIGTVLYVALLLYFFALWARFILDLVQAFSESWRPRVPAIAHVDGTARIQTVDREVDPVYHGLISAFDKKTGYFTRSILCVP